MISKSDVISTFEEKTEMAEKAAKSSKLKVEKWVSVFDSFLEKKVTKTGAHISGELLQHVYLRCLLLGR